MQLQKSELVAGFMDDLTFGGPKDVVAADIDLIRDGQNLTGLLINAAKCEIISRSPAPGSPGITVQQLHLSGTRGSRTSGSTAVHWK